MTIIIGASLADTLNGSEGNDIVLGLADDDILSGGVGSDLLLGHQGNDTLREAGTDWLFGGLGADFLRGGNEDDFLSGGSGNDSIFGDLGNDELYGGNGNDILNGGGFDDVEFTGDDRLYGGSGNDILIGAFGNDILDGGNGDDIVNGANGDRKFGGESLGEGEIDILTGGAGADTFVLFGTADRLGATPSYDIKGDLDYALITDFDPSKDTIQLWGKNEIDGSSINYSLGATGSSLPTGTGIYYELTNSPGIAPELVAILQNIAPDSVNLAQPYFNILM